MLTRITASPEQIGTILKKHLTLPVVSAKFSWDDEDSIGFVSCYSILGAFIEFQFRRHSACFFSIRPGGNSISYDVSYPDGPLLERLNEIGLKAEDKFWKGGQI